MAQRSDERDGFPVAMRHLLDKPLTLRCPPVEASNGRRNAGFIDEDKPFRVEPRLLFCMALRAWPEFDEFGRRKGGGANVLIIDKNDERGPDELDMKPTQSALVQQTRNIDDLLIGHGFLGTAYFPPT